MEIPSELRYTRDHEWLRVEGDEAVVGITDYAQGELGDIVYLELPEAGTEVTSGKPFGTIEAVKAAADMFAPVNGEIIAVNRLLEDSPELINQQPYEEGWIIRIRLKNREDVETLLSAEEYRKLVEGGGGN